MYAGKVVERADVDTIFEQAASPVHEGPPRLDPAARREARPARGHQGRRAQPPEPALRLPVQAALPVRDADLRRGAAVPAVGRRPHVALLADARGRAARASAPTPADGRRARPRPQRLVGRRAPMTGAVGAAERAGEPDATSAAASRAETNANAGQATGPAVRPQRHQALRHPGRPAGRQQGRVGARRGRRHRSTSGEARRSAWWASRVAARRPWARSCWA